MQNIMLIFTSIFLFAASAGAQPNTYTPAIKTELKRLQKCYGMWVRQALPVSDPLWIRVSTGAESGTAACMELLDQAKIGTNGEIAPLANGNFNEVGSRVMEGLLEMTQNHFEIPDTAGAIESATAEAFRQIPEIIDVNDPSYQFLYSMLKPGEAFSNVVTRNASLHAIRYTQKSSRRHGAYVFNTSLSFTQGGGDQNEQSYAWFPTLLETGKLKGLKPETVVNRLDHAAKRFYWDSNEARIFEGKNVNEHLGAGVLGSQIYLLANNNKGGEEGENRGVDGGIKSYRLWAKRVMGDLLCRTLPALRSSDVLSQVKMTSTLPYRQGISCMQCHATMDPMAGSIRDLRVGYNLYTVNVGNTGIKFFSRAPASLPAQDYPELGPDPDFWKRPAQAKFSYRGYDGQLINIEATGLADLGAKLAATNDLYACAAKHYFTSLTGIDVDLSDLTDPINSPTLNASQTYYRNKVIELGTQLKSNQSLRTLIQSIIASPAFVNPETGV